ncbi:hypothetical protein KC344_g77 [Hortaea werneckii]|nr:hypothetical protein KC344_g77 [Hortaea werneckii]
MLSSRIRIRLSGYVTCAKNSQAQSLHESTNGVEILLRVEVYGSDNGFDRRREGGLADRAAVARVGEDTSLNAM